MDRPRTWGFGAVLCATAVALGAGIAPPTTPAAAPVPSKRRPPVAVERTRAAVPLRAPVAGTEEGAAPERETERVYLIYLVDGGEPIIVDRYRQETGMVVFEKYGGTVRIPTYEIVRIVADERDRFDILPAPPPPVTGMAPRLPEANLYVTMRGGGNLRVTGFTPEGDRVRVAVPDGSFTVPRSEILGVVRVPAGSETPEAWLSIKSSDAAPAGAAPESAGLVPAAPDPRLPYPKSDHPHVIRLSTGQLMRAEAFWVEDGEFRFRRLGGVVGVGLGEVLRLIPEELVRVRGRTPVRFARRLGPDLLEVRVRSGYHRVRLLGIEVADGTTPEGNPWEELARGTLVHLEFDRHRYDAEGNWLAYVFLPSGRMLNAELVRVGRARPRGGGGNVRYLDLFHELTGPGVPAALVEPAPD